MSTHSEKEKQKLMYFRIKDLYKNKKYKAFEKESTKYLDKYPEDFIVRFMRAKTYRKLNKFDEAINDLKYNLTLEDNNYSLTELFYIYYYLNMYDEALKIINILYKKKCIHSYSLLITEIIMKKQLGLDINMNVNLTSNYITTQVLNYSEEKAIEHIKNNHIDTAENLSKFNKDINLNYLFNLIKENINNEKKVNTEEILEIHYISIANIGYVDNIPCNFIKVVVIPNTNDILNIYPTNDVDYDYIYNFYIDYDKLFNFEKQKIKKISQIDKFNNKYKGV